MKVEQILKDKSNEIISIDHEAVIADAVRLLSEKHIGVLIVNDQHGKIHGIISERDIVKACHSNPGNVKGLSVANVMTPREKLIIATQSDDINAIMNMMTNNRIRHIPVIENNQIIGMLSIGDIIKAILEVAHHENRMLKDFIDAKYPA